MEMKLGDAINLPATMRFSNDLQLKANLAGGQELFQQHSSRVPVTSRDTAMLAAALESGEITEAEHADRVSRAVPMDKDAELALRGMATERSEALRTGASLVPRDGERLSAAAAAADWRNHDAAMTFDEMELASEPTAASAFSLPQKRPGVDVVAQAAKRVAAGEVPSLGLTPTASALTTASTSAAPTSLDPLPGSAPTLDQARIDTVFSFLSTNDAPGAIVGRFVHNWLPLEAAQAPGTRLQVTGQQKSKVRITLMRQRAFLFKALSLTVADDGQSVPRPELLRHVLHDVDMPAARKVEWAEDLGGMRRLEMMRYVYGVDDLKKNYNIDMTVVEKLRAGIDADGATKPDPALQPPPPQQQELALTPPAPTPPALRRFVALDPGLASSRFGVAVATVEAATKKIIRVEQTSFKPRGYADRTKQDVRLGSTFERLVPMLRGAEEVFIEPYFYAAGTATGADTSFYLRAAGHVAAHQAGAGCTTEVNSSNWKKSFPGVRRESLYNRFRILPPACNDATDAICIILHELVVTRGYPLAVSAYETVAEET